MKIQIIARNIVNQDEIKEFLTLCEEGVNKDEVISWINTKLKKYIKDELETVKKFSKIEKNQPDWLVKSIKEGSAFKIEFKNSFRNQVKHILDYLMSIEDKRELSKISKLTFKIALDKSKEWTKSLKTESGEFEDRKEVEILRQYKKGIKWVEVFGKKALEREGDLLEHCVGGYYAKVRDGECRIVSLRNSSNKPECTIELQDNRINQIKGYKDGPINPMYSKYVEDFLENPIKGIKFSKVNELYNAYILSINEHYKSIFNLKEKGLKIDTNIEVEDADFDLPENLTVYGNIYISGYKKTFLPKGLKVYGDLNISYSNILELPENLFVRDELGISNTHITYFPDSMVVRGGINSFKTKIDHLPDNFKVNGDFTPPDTLKKLPDNLVVKGSLYLNKSKLTTLPKNLVVGESLYLEKSMIENIPLDIKVGNDLDLNDKIKELPLKIINGNLTLYTNTKLLDGLVVKGTIHNPMSISIDYPNNLTIDTAHFSNTKIPRGLNARYVVIWEGVNSIPDDIKVDKLEITDNSLIKQLPKNLKLKDLTLYKSAVTEIPDGTTIPEGTMYIKTGTNITKIGKNCVISDIFITYDSIKEAFKLPDDFRCFNFKIEPYLRREFRRLNPAFDNSSGESRSIFT